MKSYPPFLKHTNSGTVVDTRTKICVASVREKSKIGRTGSWNYVHYRQAWEECKDPATVWTDAFGVTHDVTPLTS